LPEASLIFLDELLNANSAILNSLLMVLNEKIFRRGRETRKLPALMVLGASNHLPEDEALQALFDRFLLRVRCDNVDPGLLDAVLNAGWVMEQRTKEEKPEITVEEVRGLQMLTAKIDLEDIRPVYIELVHQLRNSGLMVSDRRAVKLQRVIGASAVICKRNKAILADLWVLRHIWDTEEQREIITNMVNAAIAAGLTAAGIHPRAAESSQPDAEELFKEVEHLTAQWNDPEATMAARALIKDRLTHLNGRCEWISNDEQRKYVQAPIDKLWNEIIHKA